MFNTVIDQVKAVRNETEVVIVKLGTVTEVTGGKAKVKLYGDSAASNKLYQYIDGYLPEVNDKVALLPQGKTYIILGKITDDTPTQKWATVNHNHDGVYLPVAFATKLDDGTNKVELSGAVLLPGANNSISLGSSSKMYAASYFKDLYVDGVQIQPDRIKVTSGGTTYSLVLSYASSTATLTPSADNTFALGTSAKKFKEAYLGNIRGTWKSGQSTERALSWNSSNAMVPDSNNAVDLGTASYIFKQLFLATLVGAAYQYQSGSANNIAWNSATELAPNNSSAVNLGSSTKQFNKVYLKELYINGTQFDPSGTVTVAALTTKYGSTNYTLTLSVKNAGSSNQYYELAPSVKDKFDLGDSSYQFRYLYAKSWIYQTRYITWDTSYNIYPDTTNAVSLGTSSKQYKNIYGQNIYVNGTAVSSDRNLKEDIEGLDERFEEFFKLLKPARYKFKEGTSGRKHTGFIAQEVEEAAHEAGLSDKDIAVVVKDPESGQYYLRYEEIIAVQASVIQNMQKKVDSLEARIARLEALLERSTK